MRIRVRDVQRAAAEVLGVSVKDLIGPRQDAPVAEARHLAVFISRELTARSFEFIGTIFKRKHLAVMNSMTAARRLVKARPELEDKLDAIRLRAIANAARHQAQMDALAKSLATQPEKRRA